jgi:hypothetical protein
MVEPKPTSAATRAAESIEKGIGAAP